MPGVNYLSCYPSNYSNVSIHPVLCNQLIGSYFSSYNAIENQNRMRQSDIALEKYWATQSGYFRLATIVALGIGITNAKLLLYNGV